jgi:hypothetical protein
VDEFAKKLSYDVTGDGVTEQVPAIDVVIRNTDPSLVTFDGLLDCAEFGKVRDETGGVGGTVPATLALTLGAPASFGAFQPGVEKDYAASSTATVISTSGDAALSVADPSSTSTGHLVNGTYSLPQAVQAGVGSAFAPVGGSSAPTLLKTWVAPTSKRQRRTKSFVPGRDKCS